MRWAIPRVAGVDPSRKLERRIEILEGDVENARAHVDALEREIRGTRDRLTGDPALTKEPTRSNAKPSASDGRLRELAAVDRRWRKHLLDNVRGLAPYMAVKIDGTLYFFDTSDPTGSALFIEQRARTDHTHLRRALHALDRAGVPAVRDVFLDVGAHIGTTTLFALRQLRFSAAVAIEPSLENVRVLRLSAVANGLERVIQVVHAAASSSEGVSELAVGGLGSEYHHLVSAGGDELRQLVSTVTIDGLAAGDLLDAQRVGLVWMDIEGFEIQALEGASILLERGVPVVMEVCRDKLQRAGALKLAGALVEEHYTHILDLRIRPDESRFRPARDLAEVIHGYGRRCTDVLLCRLPPGTSI